MKNLGAEFIGTFALVFAGTGAIVIDETTGGAVTHVGVALTFGLIVLAMIYAVGDISGAHEERLERTRRVRDEIGAKIDSFCEEHCVADKA